MCKERKVTKEDDKEGLARLTELDGRKGKTDAAPPSAILSRCRLLLTSVVSK